MQQNQNGPRRPGQNNTRRSQNGSRKAYDWTKDRSPSGNHRNRRPQGSHQGQVLDFSGSSRSGQSQRPRRPDNSIQFPQQPHRPTNPNRPYSTGYRQDQRPSGQRPRQNTTVYPGNARPRNGQANRPGQGYSGQDRRQQNGRYRPTEANLRSPARREGRKKRRLTRKAIRRRRAIRRLTALGLLFCVIGVGVYLTVTMLFKINTLEVVSDGKVVDEIGGYSSSEILTALGVQAEQNIFSFDPSQKAAELEKEFPMLENIRVERDYPNTVAVKVNAATPAYAMQTSDGWLSLSAGLKILDKDSAQPELPVLYGGDPVSTTPGAQLEYELPAASSSASSDSAASDSAASSEAEVQTDKRLESLNTLLTALESSGLGADVTRIEFEDPEQMAFLYQGRISVLLGTLNELDYKLRLAKYVLLNEDGKGCSETDTGMLDLSHLSASTTRKFRFAQGEPTLPSGYVAPAVSDAPADSTDTADAVTEPEAADNTAENTDTGTADADPAPAEEPTATAAVQQ